MNEKQTILSASTSPSDEIDIVDDSEVELREFHIPSELHGERIDKALAIEKVSRKRVPVRAWAKDPSLAA